MKAISLIFLTSEGLFLTKKRETWILPGGKPKEGESDYECLIRELNEELSVSEEQIKIYNFYNSFIGKTPYSEKDLEAKAYFGSLSGRIKPNNEIEEAIFVKNFENYKISEITSKIISSLKEDKYL